MRDPSLPILVVDDDKANLEMIERRLEVDGFDTVLVETGSEALTHVTSREFQAVLLDLRLPDMTGLEVLVAIKATHPDLPVLIMTAHGSEALAVRALTEGASDYLIKPVSRRELLSALRSAIEKMALQTENRRIQKDLMETVQALEESLDESLRNKNRLEYLMDLMDEGVVVVDGQGQIERLNAEAMRALQLTEKPGDVHGLWGGVLDAVDESGAPLPRTLPAPDLRLDASEIEVTLVSGDTKFFMVSTKPLPEQGGLLITLRDITARRSRRDRLEVLLRDLSEELERAEARRIQEVEAASAEAERLKTDILAAISHELRTPLNFIVGFGSVLADGVAGELTAEQVQLVHKMLHGAERLASTVEDLLNFAMLTSGMLSPRLEPVAVGQVLDETVAGLREDALSKHQTLSVVRATDVGDDLVTTDMGFLRNVVRQLVVNAIKFTPEYGDIDVRLDRESPSGRLTITVSDTGIGIDPQALPQLFDLFYQVESHVSRRFGGTGTGLALVKGLSELLGAEVRVESRVGEGSTFTVRLPAERAMDGRHP